MQVQQNTQSVTFQYRCKCNKTLKVLHFNIDASATKHTKCYILIFVRFLTVYL